MKPNELLEIAYNPNMDKIFKFIKEQAEKGETEIQICIPMSNIQALKLKQFGYTITVDSEKTYTVYLSGYKKQSIFDKFLNGAEIEL